MEKCMPHLTNKLRHATIYKNVKAVKGRVLRMGCFQRAVEAEITAADGVGR